MIRTQFIALPDGGIGVFPRPRGACYVYQWPGDFNTPGWNPGGSRSIFVPLEFLVDLNASKSALWQATQRVLNTVVRPLRRHEDMILTLVYRWQLVGFIWSQEPVEPRIRGWSPRYHRDATPPRRRPPWWGGGEI